MANKPDGRYAYRPWNRSPRTDSDFLPSDDGEQKRAQAMSSITIPGEYLSQIVRPPLPQVNPFPEKFGYRARQLSINDIIAVDDIYDVPPISASGAQPGYQGTSRNAQSEGTW